jgi:hypothetical protein
VDQFWNNAVEVLDCAASAPADGMSQDVAILVEPGAGLRIVMSEGWNPESLQAHYGTQTTVYQVTHTRQGVRVEGCGHGLSCVLERQKKAPILPGLSAALPAYSVVPSRWLTAAE